MSPRSVIGIPDDVWGEAVHAIVVPKEGTHRPPSYHCARTKVDRGLQGPKSVEIAPNHCRSRALKY